MILGDKLGWYTMSYLIAMYIMKRPVYGKSTSVISLNTAVHPQRQGGEGVLALIHAFSLIQSYRQPGFG